MLGVLTQVLGLLLSGREKESDSISYLVGNLSVALSVKVPRRRDLLNRLNAG